MKGGELQFLKHSKEKAKKLLETGKFCNNDLETASYEKNGYCIAVQGRIFLIYCNRLPLRSKKAGRLEKLPGFARSPSIVTRASVSLSSGTTPHPSYLSKS